MVEIDKNISIPETRGRRAFYPWAEMLEGDSFLFPPWILRSSAQSSISGAGRKYGKKFIVRQTDDGYRCFCVKIYSIPKCENISIPRLDPRGPAIRLPDPDEEF